MQIQKTKVMIVMQYILHVRCNTQCMRDACTKQYTMIYASAQIHHVNDCVQLSSLQRARNSNRFINVNQTIFHGINLRCIQTRTDTRSHSPKNMKTPCVYLANRKYWLLLEQLGHM